MVSVHWSMGMNGDCAIRHYDEIPSWWFFIARCLARHRGLFWQERMTVEAGKKKKRESFVPGLCRNAVSTFGNPATTVSRGQPGKKHIDSWGIVLFLGHGWVGHILSVLVDKVVHCIAVVVWLCWLLVCEYGNVTWFFGVIVLLLILLAPLELGVWH